MSLCIFHEQLTNVATKSIETGRHTHTEEEIRQARIRALIVAVAEFIFNEEYNENGEGSTYEKLERIYHETQRAIHTRGRKGLDWIFQFEQYANVELTDQERARTWPQLLNEIDQICVDPYEIHQVVNLYTGTSVERDAYAYICEVKFVSSGQWGSDFIHPNLHSIPRDRASTIEVVYDRQIPGSPREPNQLTIGDHPHYNQCVPYAKIEGLFEKGYIRYNANMSEYDDDSMSIQSTDTSQLNEQNEIPTNINVTNQYPQDDVSTLSFRPRHNNDGDEQTIQNNPTNRTTQVQQPSFDPLFDSSSESNANYSSSSSSSGNMSISNPNDTEGHTYIRLANRPADVTRFIISPERRVHPRRTLQLIIQQRRNNGYEGDWESFGYSSDEENEVEV